jgi:hypothetical protein
VETSGSGGHKIINFVGNENTHFTQQFARPAYRAQFHSPEHYHAVSRNNILARITERVPGWARSMVGLES